MKIGITERGDAGIDFSWYEKLIADNSKYDAAVLITKNLNDTFREKVMDLHRKGKKIIIHATCTGWGSSDVEPGVPYFTKQLDNICSLLKSGFPLECCVLRIDPIIPTESGLKAAESVIRGALQRKILPKARIRISILDEYKHVKERLQNNGYSSFYPGNQFQPSLEDVKRVAETLTGIYPGLIFETCAEEILAKMNPEIFQIKGCISETDLHILGMDKELETFSENPQNRKGCHCLSCKVELLIQKHRCPHGCLYCYWRE